MQKLTAAQRRILDFILVELRSGRPVPTQREIAAHFNFKSHRAAACHLDALKRKGFLESERGKRGPSALRVPTVAEVPQPLSWTFHFRLRFTAPAFPVTVNRNRGSRID